MSTKGYRQTSLTKQRIAVANTKDRTILHKKIEEYIQNLKKTDFPSITSCAIYAGISEKTLLSYELRSDDDSEIRVLLDMIRDLQKQALELNGLYKTYDSKITTLLLKANHGLREEPTNLTQNNTFNVSPELLAEAIEISRQKK